MNTFLIVLLLISVKTYSLEVSNNDVIVLNEDSISYALKNGTNQINNLQTATENYDKIIERIDSLIDIIESRLLTSIEDKTNSSDFLSISIFEILILLVVGLANYWGYRILSKSNIQRVSNEIKEKWLNEFRGNLSEFILMVFEVFANKKTRKEVEKLLGELESSDDEYKNDKLIEGYKFNRKLTVEASKQISKLRSTFTMLSLYLDLNKEKENEVYLLAEGIYDSVLTVDDEKFEDNLKSAIEKSKLLTSKCQKLFSSIYTDVGRF